MKANELKVKDLMIGDWVMSFGAPHKVVGIRTDMFEPHIKTDMSDTWYEEGIENLLEPIPLTPEILEKNGFETHPSNLRMFFEHDDYRLCYYLNSSNRFTSFNNIDGSLVQKVIVNVHQLQHALKLCGIDKEIEL